MTSPRRRWSIVAAVAVLTIAGLGVVGVRADPALPPIAADELVASALDALAARFSISGDVATRLDLGIPQLPSSVGGGLGVLGLVAGDQRFKIWRSPQGLRVAHYLNFSERDLVANADDAWFWDSADMTAVHAPVPPGMRRPDANAVVTGIGHEDLVALARRVLDAAAPYAVVSVDGATTVAGRPCYELRLMPRSTLTLIGRIDVAIDADIRLPLRVRVFPRGAGEPALQSGFESVSFDAIDPSMFVFTPPPGATVREASDLVGATQPAAGANEDATPSTSDVRVFGRGFDLRVAVRLHEPLPSEVRPLLPYAGPLLSTITVVRDGVTWMLFGPVGVTTLQRDAASLP